ncbi:MAG TPA: HAD-IC family P-type ATPase [Saprospiraceae bacterium]|nr:HAD-IC family P-type ATPase [Saprospiraceae bacterium]
MDNKHILTEKIKHPWHALPVDVVLQLLNTSTTGISHEEASERLKTYGENSIPDPGQRHWIWILIKQFRSLLIFILFAAAFISWLTGHKVDTFVILAVIVINAFIGYIQEFRADKAVAALKSMLVPKAKVIRSGNTQWMDASKLVPGDLIILEEGDSIPADARIIKARSARAIEAALTGESIPVEKTSQALPEVTILAEQRNMVRKGTFIAVGTIKAVVTGTGPDTSIGEIARTIGKIKPGRSNFQKKTDVLARQMAVIALISALSLFMVAWYMQNHDMEEILLISIAALVSAIPEGLPAVLAIVLAIGAHRMSKRNAIIREFTATETLGAVTTIITDKTGTLTQNALYVRRLFLFNEEEYRITGTGWEPKGEFLQSGKRITPLSNNQLKQALKICGWCNHASILWNQEKNSYQVTGDPTEAALLVLAAKAGLEPRKFPELVKMDDLPFDSHLKMRASLIRERDLQEILIVGAPEKVLECCQYFLSSDGIEELSNDFRAEILSKIENWSDQAMRVIGLAYKIEENNSNTLDISQLSGLVFSGLAGMVDPPRPDVKEAVEQCKNAGIRVIMATGDHAKTAMAVARVTGITDDHNTSERAFTEAELESFSEKEFEEIILSHNVFARLTPVMKMRIAGSLQDKGELIAMTGDGVNDAPALKKADVGVAMGIMGTDVARDAATIVLADDHFSTIVNAIEEGRIVFINARQTSFFLITTNFAEIITLVTAIAIGLPVPLTATQILWLNLVTDGIGDISLATEQGHGDVLEEKPVNPKEKILNREVLPFLFINAVLMTLLTLLAFQWFLPHSLEKARSAAFIIMGFSQLYNVFNMRSLKLSVFRIGIFSNKFVNLAIFVSVVIQVLIIELPFFERLFRFEAINFTEFFVLGLMASSVLWFGELYKHLRYRKKNIKWSKSLQH